MKKILFAFGIAMITFLVCKMIFVWVYKLANILLKNKDTHSRKYDFLFSASLQLLFICIWSSSVSWTIDKFGLSLIEEYISLCLLGMLCVVWCYFSWDAERIFVRPCIAAKEERNSKIIVLYLSVFVFEICYGYQQTLEAVGELSKINPLYVITNSSIILAALALDRFLNQLVPEKESENLYEYNEHLKKEEIKEKRVFEKKRYSLIVMVIGVFLFLIILFEKQGIHFDGNSDLWIGLIGAVLGGSFTLIGVLLAHYYEEQQNEEKKRLENMPILGFDVLEHSDVEKKDVDCFLSYYDNEIITSGFEFLEEGIWSLVKIWNLNDAHVFDFTVEGLLINGKSVKMGYGFNPAMRRIAKGEECKMLFFFGEEVYENLFCLLRFSYTDIFGNKYYQDLPFTYMETYYANDEKRRQIIEIRDIKSPILVKTYDKSFEDTVKEYIDYDIFCL